ncbi:hypothetical protein VTK56DRAFT_9293 [Thermocarpiscus australiensis]
MAESTRAAAAPLLPRVTIQFCTQCKWMLRAAYYAQELLSTFSTSLGEVALQPATGGVFVVEITTSNTDATTSPLSAAAANDQPPAVPRRQVLWDRKADGGFPETKELKRRVRDVIQPGRDLGHVDRDHGKGKEKEKGDSGEGKKPNVEEREEGGKACNVEEGKCEECE